MLLSTRVFILNTRWIAKAAYPREISDILDKEPFDVVVICHSVEPSEAVSLVEAIRKERPAIRILALETLPGAAAGLDVAATAVTTSGPSNMLAAIENLLKQSDPHRI